MDLMVLILTPNCCVDILPLWFTLIISSDIVKEVMLQLDEYFTVDLILLIRATTTTLL